MDEMKKKTGARLTDIPGVGLSIASDLEELGVCRAGDLKGKDPETLYKDLCRIRGTHIDRCVLYVFRCAVYYAETEKHDGALLKWWNWSDKNLKRDQ